MFIEVQEAALLEGGENWMIPNLNQAGHSSLKSVLTYLKKIDEIIPQDISSVLDSYGA